MKEAEERFGYETYDTFLAVFNNYEEERQEAKKILDSQFGKGSYRRHIKRFEDQGIMSIFQQSPTKEAVFFANAVGDIVCRRLGKVFIPTEL
jgi:hypothetical protein